MKWFAAAVLMVGLLGLVACGAPGAGSAAPAGNAELLPAAEYHKLTPAEAKERLDSGDTLILLDVRTQSEFDEGHIPGAVCLPNEDIGSEMPDSLPDKDAEILLYCRSGRRSKEAAEKLVDMGYTAVYDFGGIIDWPYDTTTD